MLGWVDKMLAAVYRRGRSLTEVSDRVAEEKRTAIRTVRDALRDAMVSAENDREHGKDEDRTASLAAASLASTTVREAHDDDVRRLVAEWRRQFDDIPKGWKEGALKGFYTEERHPRGYPEPAWSELRRAAEVAHDRLGALLRELMEPKG